MHFQYGIYNSPIPAAFIRSDPSKSSASAVSTLSQLKRVLRLEERLMLVVTSEIGAGATGIVHGGTLEVEMSGQCLFLEVVVKLAFSHQQQESLTHENAIYRYLTSKRIKGIPTQLGLFNFNGFDGGPSALLMTHGGISISNSKQLISPVARSVFTHLTLLLSFNETTDKSFLRSCKRSTTLVFCMVIFVVRIFSLITWVMPVSSISTGQRRRCRPKPRKRSSNDSSMCWTRRSNMSRVGMFGCAARCVTDK